MRNGLLIVLILLPVMMRAQTSVVHGKVVNGRKMSPLAGATVKLINQSDTAEAYVASTGSDGVFSFSSIPYHTYTLDGTFVGFAKLSKSVRVDRKDVKLDDLLMSESAVLLHEVVVRGNPVPVVQKKDTTEFNAEAFKTHPDANAEDLVAKMPGITVENGSVKAQGEDVQQVLVDGRSFFGNDPTVALRNLPADAIEKIQVFDKLSDQAEFTGFDDGQSMKTLNVITRPDRRNQQFGKSYGGYGDDGRYSAGGGINFFHDERRVSLIGLSNNVNQQNFSTQDLLGVIGNTNQRAGFFGGGGSPTRRGRGGGGGFGGGGFGGGPPGGSNNLSNFLVGQQNGITSTNSIGENYSDRPGSDLTISQSYFFNLTDNENNQRLNRQYFGSPDSSLTYNESSVASSRNANHRFDSRIQYAVDSSNSIIDQPRLYFQNNRSSGFLTGVNSLSTTQPVSQADNNTQTTSSGNNISNHIVVRHRFSTPGRTISLDFGAGYNRKDASGALQSFAQYFQDAANDTILQQSPMLTKGYSITPRLAYTEPVTNNSLLQITYNPSYSKNESDNRKYRYDPVTGGYSIQETALSNSFENEYSTQAAAMGYRLRTQGLNAMVDVSYQAASLRGEQTFPLSSTIDRTFYSVLPALTFNYNFSTHNNLRLFYRTSTRPPTIGQLQNAVDNSNPLLLTTGNPDLTQSYDRTVVSRYSLTEAGKGESFFLLFSAVNTSDYIGNSTLTARSDTVLRRGITLSKGTQLTVPVNLDGYWSVRSFLTYSVTVGFIQSNLNLNSGFTYTRTPGLVDGSENFSNSSVFSEGVVLGSNISENVDFTLSYTGNYSISHNTLESSLNNDYYYHTASLKLNLIFLDGFVFRNEMNNTLYNGLSGNFNQNLLLWNVSLGKKVLENERGEVKIAVTDLLDQNNSVNRNVTETYVEDTQNNVLGRYFMAMFTYTVR